jgi:Zn-dependent protease
MGKEYKLFTVFGVNIYAQISLLALYVLIAYGCFLGGRDIGSALVISITVPLLFILSIIAHEISHALVAQYFGFRVSKIVMFFLGGVAHMEGEPRTGWQELPAVFQGL